MALSLYDATVPAFTQMLGSTLGLLDKAEGFCRDTGTDAAALLDSRLAPDMWPLGYQFKSTAVHSIGAIEGVRKGVFFPDSAPWPDSFEGLRDRVGSAREALAAITPEEVDGFAGRPMRFEVGELRLDFTAEDFLLTFSQPNFYFHVTAAYGILRMKGVNIGKRDYLGQMRIANVAGLPTQG